MVAVVVVVVVVLVVVVFLHTVVGEMVPKNITLAGPERAALILGPFMLGFCTATKPLLNAMRWAARLVLRLWKIESTDAVKTVFTAEELTATRRSPWAPERSKTVLSCLHTILQEEWEHHRYAVRDLDALTA